MAIAAPGAFPFGVYITACVLILAGVVQYAGKLVYLRRLARRIPHPSLGRWTTSVLWGLPICDGAAIVAGIASVLLIFGPFSANLMGVPSIVQVTVDELGSVCHFALNIGLACYLVLLLFYRRWLARVAAAGPITRSSSVADAAVPHAPGPSGQASRDVRFWIAAGVAAYPVLVYILIKCTWWAATISLGHEPEPYYNDPKQINFAVGNLYAVTMVAVLGWTFYLAALCAAAWYAWSRQIADRGLRALAVLVPSLVASLWVYLELRGTLGRWLSN
jgi:hypothetical protein